MQKPKLRILQPKQKAVAFTDETLQRLLTRKAPTARTKLMWALNSNNRQTIVALTRLIRSTYREALKRAEEIGDEKTAAHCREELTKFRLTNLPKSTK